MKMNTLILMINELLEDKSVPKNVRAKMEKVRSNLEDKKQENDVKIGMSINIMDDISNDPNLPMYARTKIWNIVSIMESSRTKMR
jgi:hypothetical protein